MWKDSVSGLCLALMLTGSVAQAAPSLWRVADGSHLGFVANQAGADFEGRFEEFSARIEFDTEDLSASSFLVEVSLSSVATDNDERDDLLRSADLFHIERWPTSIFRTSGFEDLGKAASGRPVRSRFEM